MSLSPSNISLYGDITTTGFYLLGIDGNTILPRDLYRLDVNMYFFSFLSQYWGIGYKNGKRNNGYTTYKRKETLPSYGLGYRWEFKNRVNIRLDYGIGKDQSSFYFNINEAF